MTADIPNAFIQTAMPPIKEGEERVIMKITGVLVHLLVQLAPEVYGPYVVFENGSLCAGIESPVRHAVSCLSCQLPYSGTTNSEGIWRRNDLSSIPMTHVLLTDSDMGVNIRSDSMLMI